MSRAGLRILRADPVMAGLIEAAGPYRLAAGTALGRHIERSPFETLARAIAHQQLNGTAAESILARLQALFGTTFPTPELLLQAEPRRLRSAGFSFAKIAALQDLAAKTIAGVVPNAAQLESLADHEIIERLTAVRGIGRWTVEMLLIFRLRRPDVLPVDDFGVRNGFRLAYGLRGLPLPRALAEFGERWKPYRSMAAWYLWRAVELERRGALPRCRRPPRIAVRTLARKVARKVAPATRRARRKVATVAAAALLCAGLLVGRPAPAQTPGAGSSPASAAPAGAGGFGAFGSPPPFPGLIAGSVAEAAPSAPGAPPGAGAAAAWGPTVPRGPVFAHAIVVTANPLATRAGLAILRAGGSAADAAVAVQAVLGLVEPQSSGLGGGAFITWYDAASGRVIAYNGREKAPAGATPDMFEDHGHPLPFFTAVLSGRSAGVPGAVAALARLQREHGKLPWRSLFGEAEQLATGGFTVSARLANFISSPIPQARTPDARRYFTKPDGSPYVAGDVLTNSAYASTLHLLAEQGPRVIYQGHIGADIVRRVHEGPLPGTLSRADLAAYRPVEGAALCRDWQSYRVCEPPPPAGGVGVLEALLLLSHTDIAGRGPNDPTAWVELGEAQQLMYADRDCYVGDPDFVRVPVAGLLDSNYLRRRAMRIVVPAASAGTPGARGGGGRVPAAPPAPGDPPGARPCGADHTVEAGGTSEVVIVDAAGNVLSMTTTVESVFGDGRMVDGFFLNNQLTDFSFAPLDRSGHPAANAVAAGKRPRSAMSPTIVLTHDGHFAAAVGSSGGPSIIAYVLKALVASLDWGMPMQASIDLPNLVARGAAFSGEANGFTPALLQALQSDGVALQPARFEASGMQGVKVEPGGALEGAADPRREGVALGY